MKFLDGEFGLRVDEVYLLAVADFEDHLPYFINYIVRNSKSI